MDAWVMRWKWTKRIKYISMVDAILMTSTVFLMRNPDGQHVDFEYLPPLILFGVCRHKSSKK